MEKKRPNEEDIRKENEALRKHIEEELGGLSSKSSDIPPELENQFLNYVLAFEEQFVEGRETTVYDRIGRPEWVPSDDLDEKEMKMELFRVQMLLHKNNIALDTICEVEPRILYRFITEELFEENTLDITIPDTMTRFIYEEFYPNHEYNAKEATIDFVTLKLLRKVDTEDWFFNEDLKMRISQEIDKEIAIRNVKNFINSWSDFIVHHMIITSIELTNEDRRAHVKFDLAYDTTLADNTELMSFNGSGHIKLENVYERHDCAGWEVMECEIPGFKL